MACATRRLSSRWFSSSCSRWHENPLGLPRSGGPNPPPQMPRRTGPIQKRPIPNVKRVVAVASGKGGVGKSTVADFTARLRVGVLDLDIFGPSIPTLMGLQNSEEPLLTSDGAIVPLMNHGMATMSMGFLLPRSPDSNSTNDTPVVWRGLMVQKAGRTRPRARLLVIDMPPGTGDVPLTLGQLVIVDGAVIVSTPQDVALADVSKGIAMLRKVAVPVTGIPPLSVRPPEGFRATANRLGVDVLAELPLVPGVSRGGDGGLPYALTSSYKDQDGVGGSEWLKDMALVAEKIWLSMK
ncbi:P-loop containing nucleoside triphosphate hydrolase protein [Mycena galopus ATCC 62051]|nr:P-loop containing nucleoside triphosphate hydrolase protein [Mycena galopus ATCC 62051]